MRIEIPSTAERFGANLFHNIQKVYELDGGFEVDNAFSSPYHIIHQIPREQLFDIESRMVIVIPVKDERLRLLEGVLSGIPHDCLPVIISNSRRDPVDRYLMERRMVDSFCRYAKKKYVIMHQRDPLLAQLFVESGYLDVLDEEGLVRHGKAEGMLAGILLAKLLGKDFVGFVDSDNYFPGAVFEYVRLFSAGLSQSNSPYAMVRIQWHSKPKIVDTDLFFARWGRVSRITNLFLNQFISQYTGFETDALRTGNAGEHALSMDLALRLDYSAGFSIETYHFVSLMEKFGGVLPTPYPEVMKSGVDVYQMQSRNPHLHDAEKGDAHIKEMIEFSLAVMYHSPLCPEKMKKSLLKELVSQKVLAKDEIPTRPRRYPALLNADFDRAARFLDWEQHGIMAPIV
ncbi:MAG: mannosyl-3-phosphoglycerate synthase [Saprospiraceae bacterium]|nr:mannosyl-3-phosphoglycerate synthase [Saprospiraceae bacterium]